ncbi:glycosyhydrolase [Bacteroides sp. AM16-24]|uniref:glycosyl hydrolase 115 family protein n=1 Tax=Bacteroides sp. AM16-24 TaxID=2292002 RepID=UPI000E47E7CC|nr:glycosyl hydrolase 115 family protein [Bacteroides sp. AM16-24]RHI12835.1 glycosyhydrolase [Bacteroides sp. AM16-24]
MKVSLKTKIIGLLLGLALTPILKAADKFVTFNQEGGTLALTTTQQPNFSILCADEEHKGVLMAVRNLQEDFFRATNTRPYLKIGAKKQVDEGAQKLRILIGSFDKSPLIKQLVKAKKLDVRELKGRNEKFIITTVTNPIEGVEGEVLLIAGSDKRGTIYGIYELSCQIGISPWYWWADVPVESHKEIYIKKGVYTDGEPVVQYRGIFINDEWPCMGGWTTERYGGFNSKMYKHVYELLLRLKANFLWPAMWSAAFYADDPMNSPLADEMGIIIGTSHHEPMARNHQEYARNRKVYGAWNYQTNKKGIDRFFREGIERMKGKEEVVTIAMRGDGDAPMGPDTDTKLLENIVKEQRRIITEVTGKPASKTPQLWALYSEVLEYYDQGMQIPDDVMILLCDDNWGDVRRLPEPGAKRHPGGYGMYYHVDLHGAPRAYQWLNMTQIQHMWEQLYLTYTYGVDKMWILNVGDLKPNEFPTDFFLKMAWNPNAFDAGNLMDYTREFCRQQFGDEHADEAARILNLHCKYCARVTAEMLDHETYNLQSGEFKAVTDEFLALEAHAVRQFTLLPENMHDVYKELILFPVQAMANLYEMYYAVAMNRQLAMENDLRANAWADRAEYCFRRDAELCDDYNHNIAGGKWKHMMDQTHIGYTSWDEPKGGNIMPKVIRVDASLDKAIKMGGYEYEENNGVVVMEAERFARSVQKSGTQWTVIPDMGRTLSGLSLMPYTESVSGASLIYQMRLKSDLSGVCVRLILDSTLPFIKGGHSYAISLDDGVEQIVNYNSDLTWANCYSKMYPAGAARIIESKVTFPDVTLKAGVHTLTIRPLSPAIVLHKIIVDCGGGMSGRLNLMESPRTRTIK